MLRQSIVLLCLMATAALALPASVRSKPSPIARNHLEELVGALRGIAAGGSTEVPLPVLTSGSAEEATALMVEVRMSPSTSDHEARRFTGQLQDGGVVRLTLHLTTMHVEGILMTPSGHQLRYSTRTGASGLMSLYIAVEDNDDGEVMLGTPDREDELFSSPSYAQTPEHAGRSRRDAPLSENHQVCMVYVDVDASFLQSMAGDVAATYDRVRDLLAEVEAVYAGNLPDFDVRLRGVHVNPNLVPFGAVESSNGMLTFYQRWLASNPTNANGGLRGEGEPGPQEACLNILLTNTDLNGVAGAAFTASTLPSVLGGICDARIAPPLGGLPSDVRAWNVAIVSSSLGERPLSEGTIVRAIAHEIGHAAGAPHTCCLGDGCSYQTSCERRAGNRCNPEGNFYLMYPALTDHANSLTFSACSSNTIATAIQGRGDCLLTHDDADAIFSPATTTTTTTAMSTSEQTTPDQQTPPNGEPRECPEPSSPSDCHRHCIDADFSFSLHLRSFKDCEGVCFCSTFDAGSVATYTLPESSSTTITEDPRAGIVRLSPCPTCGYDDPEMKRNGAPGKNAKSKFRLETACDGGHHWNLCVKRRSGSAEIVNILRAKHLGQLEIGRVTLPTSVDYACWSLAVPAEFAVNGALYVLVTKSEGSKFQVQSQDVRINNPSGCRPY